MTSVLMPKLGGRTLEDALTWIERVTVLFETGELAVATTTVAEEDEEPATFTVVAQGVVGNADIDLMVAAAQSADVLLVCDPYDSGAAYTGSGWFTGTFPWTNYGYTAGWRWKQLNALTNVTRSGGTYKGAWILLRGVTTLALVDDHDGAGTTITASLPALDAAHVGHIAFMSDRDGAGGPGALTDWTHNLDTEDATFTYDYFTRTPGVDGTATFTGFTGGFDQILLTFEAKL